MVKPANCRSAGGRARGGRQPDLFGVKPANSLGGRGAGARPTLFGVKSVNLLGCVLFLGLAACPPSLEGAPCFGDVNCPASQHCVGKPAGPGTCVEGARGVHDYEADAGRDGGVDAGPQCASAPLAGTLTLNGFGMLPPQRAAWIDVWDHPPRVNSGDGGRFFEAPMVQVAIAGQSTGFAVPGAEVGKTYYVAGQFDLLNNGDPTDLAHDVVSEPVAVTAGFDPACDLTVDVKSLRRCVVVTLLDQMIPTPILFDEVVDVPDVTTGQELSGGVTVLGFDPDGGETVGRALSEQPDPTVLVDGGPLGGFSDAGGGSADTSPVWALAHPLNPSSLFMSDLQAYSGDYQFAVTAPGYMGTTCQVPVVVQTSAPVVDKVSQIPGWPSGSGYTLKWTSADDQDAGAISSGTAVAYFDQIILVEYVNNVPIIVWVGPHLPQTPNREQTSIVPEGSCPVPQGKQCALFLFSERDQVVASGASPARESHELSVYYLFLTIQ